MSPLKYSYRAGSAAERALTTILRRPDAATAAAAAQRRLLSYSSSISSGSNASISSRSSSVTPSSSGRPATVAAYGKTLRAGVMRDGPRQNFSTSLSHRATVVTQNMRQDEDGQDMLIDITPRAQKRLRELAAKDNNPELALRVTVQSGGCHGFQYLMSLTSADKFSAEEDTVFETEEHDARVVMDEPSLALLKGSQVDFTVELIGSQFKITGNPAATSSCGCGTSFDIKM